MSALTGVSGRTKWALGATALVLLALVAVAVIVTGHTPPTSAGHPAVKRPSPTGAKALSPSGPGLLASEEHSELEESINRMRAVPPVPPATSGRYAAVSAQARQQPDLYAAAFVRQLLTQDYRTDREQLLAWVQAESAQSTDPLVVGLTPVELRGRMAVASVQDGVNGPAPVPSHSHWADLAARQGHTTVQIQRVIEPLNWASAVAGGQITEPGRHRPPGRREGHVAHR
jgi:hypothetical protein